MIGIEKVLVPQPTVQSLLPGRLSSDIALRSPDNDDRHSRLPPQLLTGEIDCRLGLSNHCRVVEKTRRFTGGSSSGVHGSGYSKPLTDLSRRETLLQILLSENWQGRP